MLLVTGAAGFVGKHLIKKLSKKGIKIRCLVRSANKLGFKDANLEIIEGDILEPAVLDKATKNIDLVVHLAAVIKSSNPKKLEQVNVRGTKNLISACRKSNVKKIIYISSLDAALDNTNYYGATKKIGEEIIKKSDIKYIILRPSLIYGKGSKDISSLIRFVKKYPIIPVIGNGKLQPLYVDDLCEILARLIESSAQNKTYFIAGEEELTLAAFAQKIAGLSGKKIKKIYIPLWALWLPLKILGLFSRNPQLSYDSLKLLRFDKTCDISEIKKDFNFVPTNLDRGLRLVLTESGN